MLTTRSPTCSRQNVHRWYQPATGRYSRPDPLGLFDGPNPYLYAFANPTGVIDPLGLAVLVCSRKTTWGYGNHAYFYDDRDGVQPGTRTCGLGGFGQELGPPSPDLPPGWGDACNKIPDSDGREDELMECCRKKKKKPGLWVPGVNDCASVLFDCIEELELNSPGAPGGRLGQPCDRCEAAPPPETPESPR